MLPADRSRRLLAPLLCGALTLGLLAGCGSSDSPSATTGGAGSGTSDATGSGVTTTTAPAGSSLATSSSTPAGLDGASENPRSAPADGSGQALLKDVRVGRNTGFERIVFEFAGDGHPGYRIRWVDGPITEDASGEVVDVAGPAHLEMIMEPASGIDMTDGSVVYTGPDRLTVDGRTDLIQDLVRTGDFEAVLTWVAGATHKTPFRVLSLSSPARLVVDLQTP